MVNEGPQGGSPSLIDQKAYWVRKLTLGGSGALLVGPQT